MSALPLNRVDTTLASAGTGKTTTLVGQLTRFLDAGIVPDRILATTFTKKAAEELVERARAHLIDQGRSEDAIALLGARMGTVNAVCGRLVEDFAFDLGRPPGGEVVPDDSAALLFATAADDTLTRFAPALNALAERLGLSDQDTDWRVLVRRVIELARANGIDPTDLNRSADRSCDSLLALLPEADPDLSDAVLDAALREAVREAREALDGRSLKGEGAKAASAVKVAAGLFDRGELPPWSLWAKLSKPNTSKADAPFFIDVARAAAAHPRHPRLRGDLDQFIRLVFDCAARATAAFQAYKAERGLLDFTDQEALALEILRRPETQERLRENIAVVLIDEVQDASPLQVAIFSELARIATHSVWVGDPKQAIYGFRNTDANLTLAAARGIAAGTGGSSTVLSKSWRSRPGICAFVNDAFLPAFERMGLPEEASRFTDCVGDAADLSRPPLTVWHANGKTKADRSASLAGGIAAALADPSRWPVRSGSDRVARDLRASDIAVLCRGNADVEDLASALTERGVRVAVERGDLFATPEVELAMAALRWTADPGDRLSLAELVRLVGGEDEPRGWLEALGADDPDAALRAALPFASTLADLRERQLGMTPCEIVDAVILSTGVVDLACRWGHAAARLKALEAFRGVACSYEGECARLRLPATLGGLVAWLRDRKVPCPRSDEDAVQVMTYHKAKGLEWPVVVLAQLENGPRSRLFAPVVEVEGTLDWRTPLAGRWIRFWPWPYGAQAAGVHLDAAAAASAIGRHAHREARDEAVRLLYVGATRARDHLVLARNAKTAAWLGVLDTSEDPRIILPMHEGRPVVAGGVEHPARFELLAIPTEPIAGKPGDATFLGIARPRTERGPLRLRPSGSVDPTINTAIASISLGARLPLSGEPEMDLLGQAVHAFLAVDRAEVSPEHRRSQAARVLERWRVAGHLDPRDLLEAADRLWSFLALRFPGARLRREVPVHAAAGSQAIVGRIDLLVDWGDGFAIIDHKSFPGRADLWERRAIGAAPQLATYARAVATVTEAACAGLFVHMPLVGSIVEVGARDTPIAPPNLVVGIDGSSKSDTATEAAI
ncbi:UvrD-helicase domain-containing protein [Methylobacterium radiodurans]|uniref:DNA 3'-5' helicase n=1 Tax=Methylobacterium radiodurans TaxID=2202828 RepID=A0A2U8VNY1_9HYPH|nr:UvrD-helicase domain-containing protein [Methylobacterium radiodurans]AWN35086.1 DNA helicase UvrD [Methylobacterium radiodurans]